eukprot:TRINITY_DN66838_c6_g7_i2.p1 TRINITY_DN66838_c6_g7~~TRINITY_DN66838_c6_g7_i2.p1  ORF type:complete len:145 (+),score=6.78 TRINITY_DN66838_c6_g7_i2:80-514(+)
MEPEQLTIFCLAVSCRMVDWTLDRLMVRHRSTTSRGPAGDLHNNWSDTFGSMVDRVEEEWLYARDEVFLSGWSVRNHHKFPWRFRVLFCGVALWCLGCCPKGCSFAENKEDGAASVKVCVLPTELIGLMFCFWHGETFAPSQNA